MSTRQGVRVSPTTRGGLHLSDPRLTLLTRAALLAVTAAACWLRLTGLSGWDGTLTVDEARLALAGRGILEHGVPVLPSGWVYTRGLLPAYLVAGSFLVLGQGDLAARLPSILAGTALVPVMYAFGRALGGRAGGLFAALFVAGYPPLVVWSRQAWFYALYVMLFVAALLFIVRAHLRGRVRDQILAGLITGLTFFAHELGVFLLLPLALQISLRLRIFPERSRSPASQTLSPGSAGPPAGAAPVSVALSGVAETLALPGRGAPLLAAGLAFGALGLLWLLVTALRAETLAGSYGEVAEYFSPRLEGAQFRFYGRMLVDSRWLILAAALLGVPLAVARRRSVALLLWLALLPHFVHAVTIIPDRPQERYGLTLVVVLVALAVFGVAEGAQWATGRFSRLPIPSGLLTAVVLAVILVVHQDIGGGLRRGALSVREGAWLDEARELGVGPGDLVMSDLPTVVGWYVGDLDFWLSSREFEKYTLGRGDQRRDVHTGATLVRNVQDFQRLVAQPHAGRTLWVFASGRSYQWGELVDDNLKTYLERNASRRVNAGNNSRILQIDL